MNTPHIEFSKVAETKTPSTETYLEALMKMPLNRLLYEVLFGTKEQRQVEALLLYPLG